MPNIERLTELKTYLTENPETHDQTTWGFQSTACGTTACAAGWTLILAGRERWILAAIYTDRSDYDGDVPKLAGELLGLDDEQREHLFYAASDNEEALEVINALIEGTPLENTKAGFNR